MPILYRDANLDDMPQVQSIYEFYVLTSIATFEEIPPSVDEMTLRFEKVTKSGGIWLVARDDDEDTVVGYAYYSQYRDRSGYRFTVEVSYSIPFYPLFKRLGTEQRLCEE